LNYTLDGVSAKEPVIANHPVLTPRSPHPSIDSGVQAVYDRLPPRSAIPPVDQLSGVFKSGTNQIHGSMEDRYFECPSLPPGLFRQLTNCQNALEYLLPFSYHEMGATIGGPVYIPKVYNGKDKTFFYFRIPTAITRKD